MADSITEVNAIATESVSTIWAMASDFIVVIALFAIVFFFAWRGGKGFILSLNFSLYAAYALYAVFPYSSILPASTPLVHLGATLIVFAAFATLAFMILHRVIAPDFVSIGMVGLLILSLLTTGFLLALAFHAFPIAAIYEFSPAIQMLFAPDQYYFWWFIAPLGGLFFLAR